MEDEKSIGRMQGFLSLGYIYLIAMGLISETMYFNNLGINILNYSGILDVLLAPISKITSTIVSLMVFMTLFFIILETPKLIAKYRDKKWVKKLFKVDEKLSDSEIIYNTRKGFTFFLAMGLFGLFVGSGWGGGAKIAKKIKTNDFDYKDKIEFISGDIQNAEILKANNAYVFYAAKDNGKVQITPIAGIVKRIEEN